MKKTIIFSLVSMVMLMSFMINDEPKTFKNLQVLPKNITGPQLDSVMHHFNKSLGVKCGYCHAKDTASGKLNFASDAKPEKQMARMMLVMTDSINCQTFRAYNVMRPEANAVTCYTCHRGEPMPVKLPPQTDH